MSGPGFIAVSNAELAAAPRASAGDYVHCEVCPDTHEQRQDGIATSADGTTRQSPLMTYRCGENSYLAGIDGALLRGVERVDGGAL